MSWGKKKKKQLRSSNREVKVRNDHRQEADENLLQGHLGKEEGQKYKHVVLYGLKEMADDMTGL